MRRISSVALIVTTLFLAGCFNNTAISRTVKIKPFPEATSEWSFHGQSEDSATSSVITIFINNEEVIKGTFSRWDSIGHYSGKYEGKTIDADCSPVQSGMMQYNKCVIFVDSKQVTELSM